MLLKVVSLSQFRLMRVIGRGAFGKVRIVEHRESRKLYALKYIDKEECIRLDAVKNIIRERYILEELDHPFLCRLRFAFQDKHVIYMVTDLMLGGDLHFHLSRQTQFSENVIRFWFAELASAVRYLHMKGVVHRDIKPHNILMDDQGHVHLADFNIATHIQPHKLLTSNSGTGYYMAPEVYKGGGYNEAVDWWSLGVTMYECVYRKRPFEYDKADDLHSAIRRGRVHYPVLPDRPISDECLAVLQGFLELNPKKRLGYGDLGWAAVVRHPFFRSINWIKLESKLLIPPFKPATGNNFDLTYDLEELLLEPPPRTFHTLKRHNKSMMANSKDKLDLLSKEERDLLMIEEKFKHFDFTIFEKYEGFKDPVTMTVGDPPEWVKPAFEGADQGDILPIKRITTIRGLDYSQSEYDAVQSIDQQQEYGHLPWRVSGRSASVGNLTSNNSNNYFQTVLQHGNSNVNRYDPSTLAANHRKRSSTGTLRKASTVSLNVMEHYHPTNNSHHELCLNSKESSTSLSEEYALSLQGLRKKQSTKSFRERRERDRKSLQAHHQQQQQQQK